MFVSGAVAASGILNINLLLLAFVLGAICGDTVNYWIGNYIGLHVFLERFPNFVKKEYIDDTYAFFEKYGGTTIFVARFVPVVRSFAPFLAGVGTMGYDRFLFQNVLGAIPQICRGACRILSRQYSCCPGKHEPAPALCGCRYRGNDPPFNCRYRS